MKIVSSGRVLNSKAFYEKKKKRRRTKFLLFFILFLSIVYLGVFLLRQERFLITDVVIEGDNIVDRSEMIQVVRRLLDGKYLWLVPRANSLIYPRGAIKHNLISTFPRLMTVDLSLDAERKLLVNIEERSPFALYCPVSGDCYFLDESGLIFASAPSFSRGVYFVYVALNMIESPIGQRFVPSDEFQSLQYFLEKLKNININPIAFDIGETDYSLVLPQDGKIIWRKDADLKHIESNLGAFLGSDAIKAQGDFLNRILYLDLRTENKVFYKYK